MIELHFVNTTAFQEVFYTLIILLGYMAFSLIILLAIDSILTRVKRHIKRGRRER